MSLDCSSLIAENSCGDLVSEHESNALKLSRRKISSALKFLQPFKTALFNLSANNHHVYSFEEDDDFLSLL